MSTVTTILLRHTDGPKSGQVEKFTVSNDLEIKIGRGPANNVAFDLSFDSVSREHCRIKVNALLPDTYEITDLQSKNGTYVNGSAITEKTVLFAGDIIRLGKDGPVIEFDLDPKPVSHIKKTRLVDAIPAAATKMHDTNLKGITAAAATPAKETVGKQTMQHMMMQSEKKGRNRMLVIGAALLLLVATGGWIIYSNKPKKVVEQVKGETIVVGDTTNKMDAVAIMKENEKKVVFIEAGWALQLSNTKEKLYHVKMPNPAAGGAYTGVFVKNSANQIEPLLCTKGNEPLGAKIDPIGGYLTGSGFVVDTRGYIATNRHVAAPWFTSYTFPESDFPGMLVGLNAKGKLETQALVGPGDVANWVPAEAMNVNREYIQSGVKLITGDLAYMFVTFANNAQRFPVTSQTPHGTHDVAIIRADIMEDLNPVKLLNNYEEIEPGSKAIVMGYPAMSPDQFVAVRSKDAFNTNPEIVKVPVPTISEGIVGRLVKSGAGTAKVDGYMSMMGDYYQLTVNSTGPGNSGGPMFDNKGNVIGIYSAGSAKMSYAIPIKYAMELMGRSAVTK